MSLNGMGIADYDCDECKHSHFDHIDWRPPGDDRDYCRIVRCECSGYKAPGITIWKQEYEIQWPVK